VVDDGLGHRGQHLRGHRCRARSEEISLLRHGVEGSYRQSRRQPVPLRCEELRDRALGFAGMEALLAFVATLISVRLSAELLRRYLARRTPELLAWAAAVGAFAAGSGALTWGAAAGWDNATFRVYYLFGGLLAAALLGAGSLLRVGVRWVRPLTLIYVGLAVGVAIAMPLTAQVSGNSIPEAQMYLNLFPARILAIAANSLGTLAAVTVAVLGLRRRPLGNALILSGLLVAAIGSALAGLGEAESALFSAAAALLLYGGFVLPGSKAATPASEPRPDAHPEPAGAAP
jgi:hypothetical protein